MQNAAMIKGTKRIGGALLLSCMLSPTILPAAEPAPVVVELFTSQGCYSCPPADEILGELAEREDVLPLAFHVTYWDRLGWPDTLGLPAGTARQETYAGYLGSGRIYTPQMVIQGQIDVVGSQRTRVMKALAIINDNRTDTRDIAIEDSRLSIGAGKTEPATVWLAAYDDVHDVAIDRGENSGKTLRYHNSVRELTELGKLDGTPFERDLPLARLSDEGRYGVAILVQRNSDGAILTATNLVLPALC